MIDIQKIWGPMITVRVTWWPLACDCCGEIWMNPTDNRAKRNHERTCAAVGVGGEGRGGDKNWKWSEVNKICLYFCWWLSELQHFKLQIWRQLGCACVCVSGANYDGGWRAGWGVCTTAGAVFFFFFGFGDNSWHACLANRIAGVCLRRGLARKLWSVAPCDIN